MKKQKTGMKRPLLMFLLLILLLATAVMLLSCGKEKIEEPQAQKLYWNVEKYIYSDKDMTRVAREGTYYVRFAVDGKQVDLPIVDLQTVNYIDTLEVMGLTLDENGVVVEVLPVEQMGLSIAAEDYYVKSFTEDSLVCNSMGNGKGLAKTLPMNDKTQVYSIDEGGSLLCGMAGKLQLQSRILAVADSTGTLTHVYSVDPFVIGDVYWNTKRMFDSATKLSTRPLDELGRFVYTFALNGEEVTLYTRDQEIANAVDGVAARCMASSPRQPRRIWWTVPF